MNKAKDYLNEGKKILLERQKLIKLADREEDGWNVANLYVADDLAKDSDDETRINRARREAASQRRRKEQKRDKLKSKFHTRTNSFTTPKSTFNFRSGERQSAKCYICGLEGHLQYACPKKHTTDQSSRSRYW